MHSVLGNSSDFSFFFLMDWIKTNPKELFVMKESKKDWIGDHLGAIWKQQWPWTIKHLSNIHEFPTLKIKNI